MHAGQNGAAAGDLEKAGASALLGSAGGALAMFIACALFWSGYEQAGSSLNLFAKRHIDRVVGGFEIPAGWFQSVQPAFVIIFAPFVSMLWVRLAQRQLDLAAPLKFAFGLLLMGLGFLFMVVAANIVVGGAQSPAYLLILTYLLTVFGELCLSPVGLSTVTKLAPARPSLLSRRTTLTVALKASAWTMIVHTMALTPTASGGRIAIR